MCSLTGMISKIAVRLRYPVSRQVGQPTGAAQCRGVEERVIGVEVAQEPGRVLTTDGPGALVAEPADQALRGDAGQRRGDEVRLDAHVDEPDRRGGRRASCAGSRARGAR